MQLQTYTIYSIANVNLYANYEMHRRSRSFTILLFILHSTLLFQTAIFEFLIFLVNQTTDSPQNLPTQNSRHRNHHTTSSETNGSVVRL